MILRRGRLFVNWYKTAPTAVPVKRRRIGVNTYGKGKRIGWYLNVGTRCLSIGRDLR